MNHSRVPKRRTINPNLLKTRVPGDRRGTIIHRAKKDLLPRKAKHKPPTTRNQRLTNFNLES